MMRTVRWPWIFGVSALQVTWPLPGSSGRAETSNLVAGPTSRVRLGMGMVRYGDGSQHVTTHYLQYLGEQISSNFHWPTIFGYHLGAVLMKTWWVFVQIWWVVVQARCAAMAFDPSFFSSAYRLDSAPAFSAWSGAITSICQDSQDQRSLEA